MVVETDKEKRSTLFENFLRCLDREENLIHYRLTWGLQWNLAMIVLVVALLAKYQDSLSITTLLALFFLSAVGAGASLLSFIGVRAAHKQSEFLMNSIQSKLGIENDEDWSRSEFIRPYGSRSGIHIDARRASAYFPLVFILIWLILVFYTWPLVFKVFEG